MPDEFKILIAESSSLPDVAADLLRSIGTVTMVDLDRRGLLREIKGANVLWVHLRNLVDREVIAAAPVLKVIATPTTGLDHIDVEAARERDISILSLQGKVDFLREIRATAEMTLALILALLRHLPGAIEHVRSGLWERDQFRGTELFEKTVGIVGYGRLGHQVGRYLQSLGARVLATDCRPVVQDPGVVLVSLSELLNESDIVTLHADLTRDNYNFFGKSCFLQMKPGSLFINTARGNLVDEQALLDALRSGPIAGAAIDVLASEQTIDHVQHPLICYARKNSNLIITPHIGGCTTESMRKTEIFLAHCLVNELSQRKALSI